MSRDVLAVLALCRRRVAAMHRARLDPFLTEAQSQLRADAELAALVVALGIESQLTPIETPIERWPTPTAPPAI